MPPKRMTANPIKPARYRPGKPAAAEVSSSEDSDSDAEQEKEEPQKTTTRPPPAATSFPKAATQISTNLKKVDLNAQRRAQVAQKPTINEDDFETEEESGASGSERSGSGSDEEGSSEEEEESSSEDDAATRRKLLRPVFVKKDARKATNGVGEKTEDQRWQEEQKRKKERADALVRQELENQAEAKAAGKKYWDDEDNIVDEVDDTDNLDPEAERTAWKLREFTRVKRDRDALIAAEKEREEIERRRNLSKEEREAEDKIYLDAQRSEKDGKGKMGFMQKYYHKGAFFTEDLEKGGLANRDIMGGRYEDDVSMRDALPEYMQIRDMTKLGKKGRTRYKDMKSEDTGRWGDFLDKRPGARQREEGEWSRDERFRSDYDGERTGPSGANANSLGERKRPPSGEDRRDDKRLRVD